MPPDEARATYDAFVRDASARVTVATGRFGADMKVTSVNDGPVTLLVDSRRSFDRLASPATME
jgi:D-tyrosyl-tRNA(Tyr) deacylase